MKKRLQQIALAVIYAAFVTLVFYLLQMWVTWSIIAAIALIVILAFVGYRYYRDPNTRYYTLLSVLLFNTPITIMSDHEKFDWLTIGQIVIEFLILGVMVSYVWKGYPQAKKSNDK
ncbi:hypothetical protein PUF88_00095 [Lactobacillaceae bacterium L1_55_11]|nr:hypothetical protein [Lactobacillaceae bacterium L1_55_11]